MQRVSNQNKLEELGEYLLDEGYIVETVARTDDEVVTAALLSLAHDETPPYPTVTFESCSSIWRADRPEPVVFSKHGTRRN